MYAGDVLFFLGATGDYNAFHHRCRGEDESPISLSTSSSRSSAAWTVEADDRGKKTGQCVLRYDGLKKKNTEKLMISREDMLWSKDNWIFVDRNSKCLTVKERGGNTSYIKSLMAELLSRLDTKRDVIGLATYRDNKEEMRTTWPHALRRSDELLNGTPGGLKDMPVENAILAVEIACVE